MAKITSTPVSLTRWAVAIGVVGREDVQPRHPVGPSAWPAVWNARLPGSPTSFNDPSGEAEKEVMICCGCRR